MDIPTLSKHKFSHKLIKMKRTIIFLLTIFSISFAYGQIKIEVGLDSDLKGPFSGRLFIFTISDTTKQFGIGPQEGEASFSVQVNNWKQGETIKIPQNPNYLNTKLSELKNGTYKCVAVLDTNIHERGISAPGNLYSKKEVIMKVEASNSNTVKIVLTNMFPLRIFKETETIKEVVIPSTLLTKFRKETIYIKAAVVLPSNYKKEENRQYPVVYVIPGWGGVHHQALSANARKNYGVGQGEAKIFVFLNPETQTPFGLHGFVDSKVNGPWSKALVEEFIPYIQMNFNVSTQPKLNFLTGQSTGGYSVVWLSMNYPSYFGSAWATSPDPLDFRSFTGVNIYKDKNYYTKSDGSERGFNLMDGKFKTTIRSTRLIEEFEGDGGQQQSFEAEFGLPSKNGRPISLFDLQTGKINKEVVAQWRNYDLSYFGKKNKKILSKMMNGKVNIYVGDQDNFLLNQSAISFANNLKKSNLPVHVQVIKGANHFTVRNMELTNEIIKEMDLIIKENQKK